MMSDEEYQEALARPRIEQWTSLEDHQAGKCRVSPDGKINCLYCHSFGRREIILIPSETEDRVPSMMLVTEVIGRTDGKTRAGIIGTTAKVIEAYHCGSRGEVLRANTIYLDQGPRATLESIRETFPRLHKHICQP